MSSMSPSFLNAYLVAENSMGAPPVGVVRKDGNVWRILQFGISDDQQCREALQRVERQALGYSSSRSRHELTGAGRQIPQPKSPRFAGLLS